MKRLFAFVVASIVGACGSSSSPTPAGSNVDAGDDGSIAPVDSGADTAIDSGLTGECATSFGTGLPAGFGRMDGNVYAVQKPSETTCTLPNSDHVVLQVLTAAGIFRMVVNVQSDEGGTDLRVRFASLSQALPAPAFADGWHAGAALDYVTTLGLHDDGDAGSTFTPLDIDPLVTDLANRLHAGDPVSVYATVGASEPDSAHLVHRNKANQDGAIVVEPNSASPTFLVFHFADQTF